MRKDYVRICLERARNYLEDYVGDIPEEVLHNIHSTHKVSSGWFQHCGSLFDLAFKVGITDERYKTRFWKYIKEKELRDNLTTAEDIQFVDGMLKEFIAELGSINGD